MLESEILRQFKKRNPMAFKKSKKKAAKSAVKRKCSVCRKRGHNVRTCGRYDR